MIKKLLLTLILLITLLPYSSVFADVNNPMIIVKKATNELAYYENAKMVKSFRVGINNAQTPVGVYSLVLKKEKPSYLPERIPGGASNNPYGTHWLGFNYGQTNGQVYGIHGTNNPAIIGTNTTKGSISMSNEDIRWLYNQAGEKTPIVITNSTHSFDIIFQTVTNSTLTPEVIPAVTLYIDGVKQSPPQPPFIKDDRTFVPLRYIFEKIGAQVEWNDKERRIIATKDNDRLQLVIDSTLVRFNGQNADIDTAPFIKNNTTFVPVRSVFEFFGADIEWDEETRSVLVTTKKKPPVTFYINDEAQDESILSSSTIIYNGDNIEEVLVPATFIFNKFGATIEFLAHENKLIITRNEKIVELIIDSKQIKINGYYELIDNAPIFKYGQVFVPLEITERMFGAVRNYGNGNSEQTIDLNYELKELSKIFFNDNLRLPYTGYIVNNVHYMPLSLIFMELDAETDFNDTEEKIEIYKDGTLIQMHINSHSAFVNGKLVSIPHPPKIMDGQVIVPLQFITDTFGLKVNMWPYEAIYIYQ